MRKGILVVWIVLAIFLLSCTVMPRTNSAQLDKFVRDSSLIFVGKVEKVGATTTDEVAADNSTAIIAVEDVYTPTGGLGDLRQRKVTLRFDSKRNPLDAGTRAVFFANGILYGRGVVVREVDRITLKGKADLGKEIDAALQRRDDKKLAQRLSRAQAVIVGKVIDVRPVKNAEVATSEHNPRWHEAIIEVTSVERGQLTGKQVTILFPASDDEMWLDAPKFHKGQQGLWILQKDQKEKGPARMRLPGYTALNALDFQPPERIEHVRRLVKSMG